jgi:hypothetical protein
MAHLRAEGKVYSRPVFEDQGIIAYLKAEHQTGRSYNELAQELNTKGIQTARGRTWAAATIRKLILR